MTDQTAAEALRSLAAEFFDLQIAAANGHTATAYGEAARLANIRADSLAEPPAEAGTGVSEGPGAEAGRSGLSAVDAAMAAELDWFRNRRTERGGSWGMPPRAQVERLIAGAEPVIRAGERANLRALLPYHVPCCPDFLASVGDILNENEDSP